MVSKDHTIVSLLPDVFTGTAPAGFCQWCCVKQAHPWPRQWQIHRQVLLLAYSDFTDRAEPAPEHRYIWFIWNFQNRSVFGQLNDWYSMFLNNSNLCIHWTLCTSDPHSLICISVKNVIIKICVQTFTLHTGYINFCMFAITQSDLYSLWALGKCGPVRFIACRSTWSFRVRLKDCSLLHIFICISRSAWCSEIMIFFITNHTNE